MVLGLHPERPRRSTWEPEIVFIVGLGLSCPRCYLLHKLGEQGMVLGD